MTSPDNFMAGARKPDSTKQEDYSMRPTADEFRTYEAVARADVNYYRDLAENGRPDLRDYHLKCAQNRQEDADFYAHQAAWSEYLAKPKKEAA